ncbi:MAG: TonB-dependent receptor plug domain-containing protein [Bacteroidales bacterium]|nr:TonB-dependent receptor plug domain-containing protein [Bacteroidales bacterium]
MRHILITLAVWLLVQSAAAMKTRQDADRVPFNGIIMDLNGIPIRNAYVYISDAEHYANSDKKGRFGLTNVAPNDTLHILYKRKFYVIPIEGRRGVLVRLIDQNEYYVEEDVSLADLGYGFVKRREHVGVSNGISGEELVRTNCVSLLDALQGKIPGLFIRPTNRVGEQPFVAIRGINSVKGSPVPLYLIDGVMSDNLDDVSVYDVDYVEVVKDASIYGARGANGAILVHTKKGKN